MMVGIMARETSEKEEEDVGTYTISLSTPRVNALFASAYPQNKQNNGKSYNKVFQDEKITVHTIGIVK